MLSASRRVTSSTRSMSASRTSVATSSRPQASTSIRCPALCQTMTLMATTPATTSSPMPAATRTFSRLTWSPWARRNEPTPGRGACAGTAAPDGAAEGSKRWVGASVSFMAVAAPARGAGVHRRHRRCRAPA